MTETKGELAIRGMRRRFKGEKVEKREKKVEEGDLKKLIPPEPTYLKQENPSKIPPHLKQEK